MNVYFQMLMRFFSNSYFVPLYLASLGFVILGFGAVVIKGVFGRV